MAKGEIDINIKAEELGKDLEDLAKGMETQFNDAIKNAAHAAYANIISEAQSQLSSTRRDYLAGLDFEKIEENSYLITLSGDFANKLEKGFAPFDMRDTLLKSKKMVEVGNRAGQPWVQKAEEGHKYAHVPIQQKPFSKEPKGSDLASLIRKTRVENSQGKRQKITSTFKDPSGKPLEGEVARVTDVPDLEGLVKYQKVYKNEETGSEKVESVYIKYRTISEKMQSGWMHPGFQPGLEAFDKAEKWLDEEIENILKTFLGE